MNTNDRVEIEIKPRRMRQARVVKLVFQPSPTEQPEAMFQIICGGLARLIACKIAIEVGANIERPESDEKV